MSDEADPSPIGLAYARRSGRRGGQFAGLFVTLAAVNLVVGGAGLLVGLPVLLFTTFMWVAFALGTAATTTAASAKLVLTLAVAGTGNALVVIGSVGSLWCRSWARTFLRAGLSAVLLVDALAAAATWAYGLSGQITAAAVGHAAYAAVALYCYLSWRADSYFDPGPVGGPDLREEQPR